MCLARQVAHRLSQAVFGLGLLLWVSCGPAHDAPAAAGRPVFVLRIDGAIGPATAEQFERALLRAGRDRAQLLVLEMDTPGGLDSALRSIIKNILASPVPVASFVAPAGARAASAGTYILYASHIAAMSPATNLGAATPIAIGLPTPGGRPSAEPSPSASAVASPAAVGDAMAAKRVNDAAAYLRGLAQLRGRNIDWADQAVREAASLTAHEARTRRVVDLVATDLPDLLRQLEGHTVQLGASGAAPLTLATAQAPVLRLEAGWRDRLLSTLSDPSLVLVLMMLGIYGLLFEFMNPGFVAPGVIGGISLLLALWGLQLLPINYAGLALLLLGIALLVAEAFVPSYGALGLGGMAAFALGALLLFDSAVPGHGVPLSLIAAVSFSAALALIAMVSMALKARRRPAVGGSARLVGALGELVEVGADGSWALIDGQHWQVCTAAPLHPGQTVRVTAVDGLRLLVDPAPPPPLTPGA
jgi:membrane-bound serine protease (ClpP class)